MHYPFGRELAVLCLVALTTALPARSATLEKLSIEEMTQKATLIVRGRITGCAGEARGSIIYTRCGISLTERWKGQAGSTTSFAVPGGTAQGMIQTFVGTPKFTPGDEHVMFLWAGKSGMNQIIGLSQGVFSLGTSTSTGSGTKSQQMVKRAATTELMLDKAGNPVKDEAIEMTLSGLRQRVFKALASAEAQQ